MPPKKNTARAPSGTTRAAPSGTARATSGRTYNISMNGEELLVNGQSTGRPFKSRTVRDGTTDTLFDDQFWKKCFTGDSNKDGCPPKILRGFLPPSFNEEARTFTGEQIKDESKRVLDNLEINGLLIKANVERLKNYKATLATDPKLQSQMRTAFPEGYPIRVDKDCGLDPDYFLPGGTCIKSCNIASDVIDPHSSKTDDCSILFPAAGDTLILDESVFDYLQYPAPCRLQAKTIRRGIYEDMKFLVKGVVIENPVNLLTPEGIIKYFSGNETKNAGFKDENIQTTKNENMKLCIAKYSGDTLQSLIQKLFEIIVGGNFTYIISTCDFIVMLRSFILNGSFIFINKDIKQEKISQIFIWRPELSSPETLSEIFQKEKENILEEYTIFIDLVNGIETPANPLRNISLPGTHTTYKFTRDFYDRIVVDLTTIRNAINTVITIPMGAAVAVAVIAGQIRILRTFKVNDFFKIDGKGGTQYFMIRSTSYTIGNLNLLNLDKRKPTLNNNGIQKQISKTFFDVAMQYFFVPVMGGSRTNANMEVHIENCDMTNIDEVFNRFFNMEYYKDHEHDLHLQIVNDFKKIFTKKIPKRISDYTLRLFDCFSDVINSFATLDIDEQGNHTPGNEYYSENSIDLLITNYFSRKKNDLEEDITVAYQLKEHIKDAYRIKINELRRQKKSMLEQRNNIKEEEEYIKAADEYIGEAEDRKRKMKEDEREGARRDFLKNHNNKRRDKVEKYLKDKHKINTQTTRIFDKTKKAIKRNFGSSTQKNRGLRPTSPLFGSFRGDSQNLFLG